MLDLLRRRGCRLPDRLDTEIEELKKVRDEVEHLRGLLSQQHIQRQDGTA